MSVKFLMALNSIFSGLASTTMFCLVQVFLKLWINKAQLTNKFVNQLQISIPYIIIITILSLFGFLFWILAMQKARLTDIYWITSLSYIMVPVLSFIILGEKITRVSSVGYLLIVIGGILANNGD